MYYFKQSIFLFVYLITTSIASLVSVLIPTVWIRFALSMVLLIIYLIVAFVAMKQEGEKALKIRDKNDTSRKKMIKTGQVVEFDTKGEYGTYKGFFIGLISNIPMAILLLINFIIMICGSALGTFGAISTLLYSVYTSPIIALTSEVFTTMASHFITLYGLALSTIVCGVAYILGGKKAQRQFDIIEEKKKLINGED